MGIGVIERNDPALFLLCSPHWYAAFSCAPRGPASPVSLRFPYLPPEHRSEGKKRETRAHRVSMWHRPFGAW